MTEKPTPKPSARPAQRKEKTPRHRGRSRPGRRRARRPSGHRRSSTRRRRTRGRTRTRQEPTRRGTASLKSGPCHPIPRDGGTRHDTYELPPAVRNSALRPHIRRAYIWEKLHHDKTPREYVEGVNDALEKLGAARSE